MNETVSTLRHLNDKQAACTRLTLDAHPTAVGLDDALHDGQAQPTARALMTAVTVEALKDMGHRFRIDASATIAYPQFNIDVHHPGTQSHMAARRRKLQGIVDEVGQAGA